MTSSPFNEFVHVSVYLQIKHSFNMLNINPNTQSCENLIILGLSVWFGQAIDCTSNKS